MEACAYVCVCVWSLQHDLCDWLWEAAGLGGLLCYVHSDSFIEQMFFEHLLCTSTVLDPGNIAADKSDKNLCHQGTYIAMELFKALSKAWLWWSRFLIIMIRLGLWVLGETLWERSVLLMTLHEGCMISTRHHLWCWPWPLSWGSVCQIFAL